ncbi:MAG: hypothetical protein QXR73_02565, partial [Candidatus Micrarchaeaceae archaeon]
MTAIEDLKKHFELVERARDEAIKRLFSEIGDALRTVAAGSGTKDEAIRQMRELIESIMQNYYKEKGAEDREIKNEEKEFDYAESLEESTERSAYEKGEDDEYNKLY